uniref:Uncharacterized protein n=1 Tax=Anguilla anguilla TaxID=7936 RepID=A0A0E9U759_ANGAN
MWEDITCIK